MTKTKSDHFLRNTLFSMFALLLAVTIPLYLLDLVDWAITVIIGFFISFTYIFLAYITIHRAFGKSTKKFYQFLFGGMAFRFIFFLLCLFGVYKFTTLPIVGFVLAFIVFYIIFQIFEARLVLREIKHEKSA